MKPKKIRIQDDVEFVMVGYSEETDKIRVFATLTDYVTQHLPYQGGEVRMRMSAAKTKQLITALQTALHEQAYKKAMKE